MLRPLAVALVLACASTLIMPPTFARAQTSPSPLPADATELSVSSQGEASHAPDVATLSTGVVTQAASGNEAMRANAVQMDQLLAAVRNSGIAGKDVQTSGLSLAPRYHFAQNQPRKLDGYEARNTLSLKVRDLSKAGKLVDALAAAGASEIDGPNFSIDNPQPLYQQARLDALKNAQAQAETYATALGLRVRRVVSINENGNGNMRPMMKMMAAAPSPPAPYTPTAMVPGESSLTVNLDVVFELGR